MAAKGSFLALGELPGFLIETFRCYTRIEVYKGINHSGRLKKCPFSNVSETLLYPMYMQ
jgi:hypothetical protein